jgi:hypothetical protein
MKEIAYLGIIANRCRRLRVRSAVALASTITVLSLQVAHAIATPPGGRGNFVTAVMSDNGTSSWVRLAQYSFRADGTIRQDFWFWDQNTMTGWENTGITTSGCEYSCSVRTAERFEDSNSTYPKTLFGSYTVSASAVSVTWSSGSSESWSLTNQSTASRLALTSSTYGATHGWSWGSTRGFSSYATIAEMEAHSGTYTGPFQQNNWGSSASGTTSLNLAGFSMCNGSCLNQTTATTKSYLAGPNNSRKTFYNRQRFDVDPSNCIGSGGGHLNPLLQIIDDDGMFRGWVGVEASLYSEQPGSAIVAIYDLNDFVPGDLNNNGVVDSADYVVWRKNNGSLSDYNLWRANFGRTSGSGLGSEFGSPQAMVPEASGLCIAAIGGCLGFVRRRHR